MTARSQMGHIVCEYVRTKGVRAVRGMCVCVCVWLYTRVK